MQVPQVNMLRMKAFSYSIFLAGLVWYSYWIIYDMAVWNKTLIQVNPLNYIGVTAIVGLIIFETRIKPQRRYNYTVREAVADQQVMALPLRIGECPFGVDYFDKASRQEKIPSKCLKCTNIIDCACRASQNSGQAPNNNVSTD
jgi:hypothetical protein